MRIYPAVHYTMGGLWVDYDLQSNIPGLFVTGEANFSDHGANRLGASALMQGLADGYFVLPNTIRDYLAYGPYRQRSTSHTTSSRRRGRRSTSASRPCCPSRASAPSTRSTRSSATIMWEYCGMERTEEGLRKGIDLIRGLREEFWRNVRVLGTGEELNQSLEKAGRVADFLELGELMCIDALHRRESCGGHFRGESQTEEGEALRNDDELRLCRGVGVRRRRRRAGAAHARTSSTSTSSEATELQVRITLQVWRQANTDSGRPDGHLPGRRRRRRTCRSSRCSTSSTSSSSLGARTRWRSTATAARASAACAA